MARRASREREKRLLLGWPRGARQARAERQHTLRQAAVCSRNQSAKFAMLIQQYKMTSRLLLESKMINHQTICSWHWVDLDLDLTPQCVRPGKRLALAHTRSSTLCAKPASAPAPAVRLRAPPRFRNENVYVFPRQNLVITRHVLATGGRRMMHKTHAP